MTHYLGQLLVLTSQEGAYNVIAVVFREEEIEVIIELNFVIHVVSNLVKHFCQRRSTGQVSLPFDVEISENLHELSESFPVISI